MINELEQNIEDYETAAMIAKTDFSQLGEADFAQVETRDNGEKFGIVQGVAVPIAPQIEAPAPAPEEGSIRADIRRGVVRGAQSAAESLNETLPLLGKPVDWMNEGLREVGEYVGVDLSSDNPVGGSEMIRDGVSALLNFGNQLLPQGVNEAYSEYVNQPPKSPIIQTIVEAISEFGVQAVTPALYLRAFTVMSPFARGLAWGGIADFINAKPDDTSATQALTELLAGATEQERGAVANAVLQVFAQQEGDPEIVNRARMALDGMIIGGSAEKILGGIPYLIQAARTLPVKNTFDAIGGAAMSTVRGVDQALDRGVDMMGGGNTLGMGVGPVPKAAEAATDLAAASYPNTMNRMLYDPVEAPPAPEGTRKWTKATLARAMQEEAEANGQAITKYDDAARDTLGSRIAEEAATALQREGNASDWYNSKIVEMNNNLRQIHPEIEDGSTAEGIFKAGLSLTSNGSTVDYNLRAAEHVYSVFKETGRYPTDLASLEKAVGGFGQEGPTLIKQFERANTHIDEMGVDGFVEFLNTKFTVKELNAMGYKVTGEAVDFETYGSAIFGPKIGGGFYQNLRGNFEPVTFDRWWMASWGRWTGQPLKKNTAAARAKQLDRFRVATGKQYKDPNAATAAAKKIYATYRKNNFQPRTELNQSAQRLAEGATDAMKEQPAGPTERAFMRKVTYDAVEKLRQMGYNVTPADLQATVWYPEKELHGFYGIGSGRSAPDDYAAAAQRLLEERNAGR